MEAVGSSSDVVAGDVAGRHVGPEVVVPRAPRLGLREGATLNQRLDPLLVALVRHASV